MQIAQDMSIKYENHDFNIINKNPLFSEAKVYVMYHGQNRNNTHISKENVNKALESIYNIPIVGEFIESEDDMESNNFGSHGGKVVIDDNGMKYIHTTRPVGVVPESARIYWEVVKDEKDREREYLVVEGALVWNRYEAEVDTLKSANFGQSMEIEVMDGQFDDDKGIFHINEFAFSAFCILGIDGRKNGKVEPAFEDSKIITYSKENIVAEFREMKDELKEYYASYSEQKEDRKVDLEKDKKFEEELDQKESDEKKNDEDSKDEKESKESETIQTLEEGIDGQTIKDEDEAEKQKGTSGDTGDVDTGTDGGDARAVADANTDSGATTDAGNVSDTADTTSEARTVADANTDTDYSKKYKELKSEFDAMKEELEELREFKAKSDKEAHEKEAIELFDSIGLEEEDINELDIYEYSIPELEEKAYAILGKKLSENKQDFSADKEPIKKTNRVDLSQASKNKKTNKYGNLFAKYGK